MDKAGVRFESVSKGKYKSFNEPFTREGMSEAHRENLTELLSDLNGQFLDDVGADRARAFGDRGAFRARFLSPPRPETPGSSTRSPIPTIWRRGLPAASTGS